MKLIAKHSLPTRIFHWANAIVLGVMIWSGLLIYWANGVYKLEMFGLVTIPLFPAWVYDNFLVRLNFRLAEGMAWHFAFMWLFAINGVLYVAYTFVSGAWRQLLPNRSTLSEAWEVVLHDLRLRRSPLPRRKFNGAQRLAYTGVILLGAGSLVTGLAIYRPVQLAWLTALLGGYEWARFWHFALTMGYLGFFVIHILQVIRAGWNNFRAMVIGSEAAHDEETAYE